MTAFLVALHGHLPYIHHPEHPTFLEEDWLFEGVADCYLPLLMMLDGWERDGVAASFTLGLSPPLLSMLSDTRLQARTTRYLEARLSLLARVRATTPWDFRAALDAAEDETGRALSRFLAAGGHLPHAFAHHHRAGRVELMTCNATHGLLPVLQDVHVMRAQVKEAVRVHTDVIGIRPRGIWLPECGVHPHALEVLAENDLCFTFTEDRAVRLAWPPPIADVYRPLFSPDGVACFPRDPDSAREVWSAEQGYPGDSRYREFYRDLGYDAGESLLDDVHRQGTGARKNVGVKLHRITGKVELHHKAPYVPAWANEAVAEHAAHFARARQHDAVRLAQVFSAGGAEPAIVAAFDAELFGHWWHEGPQFLDRVLRQLAADAPNGGPAPMTAHHYLERNPTQQISNPAVSSWGDGGAFEVWVNAHNDWLWRRVHDGQLRYEAAVRDVAHHAERCDARKDVLHQAKVRVLEQAARELLLAQSSDWPFILTMGTQTGYAKRRPVVHLSRLHRLLDALERGREQHPSVVADVAQMQERDTVFPRVDVNTLGNRN